jgi:hypothetical protein
MHESCYCKFITILNTHFLYSCICLSFTIQLTLPFTLLWPFQALPLFLDRMFHPVVAVILSVTFVLAFGEVLVWCSNITFPHQIVWLMVDVYHQVIPQAICTRYGLAVGANFVWLVRILMVLCYPIAYPIGKVYQQIHLIQFKILFCFMSWFPWVIYTACDELGYRVIFFLTLFLKIPVTGMRDVWPHISPHNYSLCLFSLLVFLYLSKSWTFSWVYFTNHFELISTNL